MPGTASTRNAERDHHRSRPNSVGRLASTGAPVLFRLPLIETATQVLEVYEDDLAPKESEVAASLGVLPVPPPVVAASAVPEVPAPQPLHGSAPPLAGAVPQAQPVRSWWEHWSSGIVLILLVIALVAASIIALNDSRATEVLVSSDREAATDEFDLANIRIPDIELGPASSSLVNNLPKEHAQSVAGEVAELVVPHLVAATDSPTLLDQDMLLQQNTTQITEYQAEASESGDSLILGQIDLSNLSVASAIAGSTAIGSGLDSSIVAQDVSMPATNMDSSQPVSSGPLATLSLPVGMETPTQSASTPLVPAQALPGASPAFYDGAATQPSQQLTSGGTSVHTASGPIDTNMPAFSSVLTGLATNSASLSTVSHRHELSGMQGMVSSATPDMDADAIVKAYLQFKELNKAQHGLPSNRFQEAAQEQPNGMVPSANAGSSFMLGSPQQVPAGWTDPGN